MTVHLEVNIGLQDKDFDIADYSLYLNILSLPEPEVLAKKVSSLQEEHEFQEIRYLLLTDIENHGETFNTIASLIPFIYDPNKFTLFAIHYIRLQGESRLHAIPPAPLLLALHDAIEKMQSKSSRLNITMYWRKQAYSLVKFRESVTLSDIGKVNEVNKLSLRFFMYFSGLCQQIKLGNKKNKLIRRIISCYDHPPVIKPTSFYMENGNFMEATEISLYGIKVKGTNKRRILAAYSFYCAGRLPPHSFFSYLRQCQGKLVDSVFQPMGMFYVNEALKNYLIKVFKIDLRVIE